jgi:hypothetical protein
MQWTKQQMEVDGPIESSQSNGSNGTFGPTGEEENNQMELMEVDRTNASHRPTE